MTTEREFAEWPEKIRRVRGQSPRPSSRRSRGKSLWWRVMFFLGGLAIAVVISNQMQQPPQQDSQPRIIQESQL